VKNVGAVSNVSFSMKLQRIQQQVRGAVGSRMRSSNTTCRARALSVNRSSASGGRKS